jgi:thiol:disulfide interchange protein
MRRNIAAEPQDSQESGLRSGTERSIFRAEALKRYAQNQERAVFPRLVSPHSFRLLWLAAVFFLVAGLLIAFWPLIAPLIAGAA